MAYYSEDGTGSATWAVEEVPQNPPPAGVRKQLSSQEWEDLKPLIRVLYIEEGRTFAYIADVLLQDHNFKPTKKQFDDRIKKWDLRKNTKKNERKSILQNVEALGESSEVEISGRKHKKAKLERWQREFQGSSASYTLSTPAQEAQGSMSSERTLEPSAATEATKYEPCTAMDIDPLPQLESDIEMPFGVYEEDPWPFNRWANVDVIGSPKLTHLFENLRIETGDLPDDIETLILSPLACASAAQDEGQYITAQDLTMTHYFGNSSKKSWNTAGTSSPMVLIPAPQITRIEQHAKWTPFKIPNADAWVPLGAQLRRSPSPFNELYPFPASSPSLARATITPNPSIQVVKFQALLSSLKRAGVRGKHPGVLRTKEELADAYLGLGMYKEAGNLYKILASAYRKSDGVHSYAALSLQVNLALCLAIQRKTIEADNVLSELSPVIRTTFGPRHELMRNFLIAKFWTLYYKGDFHSAENTCRELVQVQLAVLGPRDTATIYALQNLGIVMRKRATYSESEKFHAVAVQLLQGSAGAHKSFVEAWRELAQTLAAQDRFEEAISLLRIARERGCKNLGDVSITVSNIEYNMSLRTNGKDFFYTEALAAYHEMMEIIRHAKGDGHANILKLQEYIDEVHEALAEAYERDNEVGTDEDLAGDENHEEAQIPCESIEEYDMDEEIQEWMIPMD